VAVASRQRWPRTASIARFGSIVHQHVLPESIVYTDEWAGYHKLDQHYAEHRRIRHAEKIYVEGDVHTNTIEDSSAPKARDRRHLSRCVS
jgi:transposase-like protein